VDIPERGCKGRNSFTKKYLDIHLPNSLANDVGKRKQNFHGRHNPSCESIVAILGLGERRYFFMEDGEDSVGGIAGLKPGKKRMRCEVFLGLTFVSIQSLVENGRKGGLRGGCGRDSGHDGS
jgi:hypothetical protein